MWPSRPGRRIVLATAVILTACMPATTGTPNGPTSGPSSEAPGPTTSAASVALIGTWTSQPFGYVDIETALGEASLPSGDVAILAADQNFAPWPVGPQSPEIVTVFTLNPDGSWTTAVTSGDQTVSIGDGTGALDAATITLSPSEGGDGTILATELADGTLTLRLLRIVRTGSHEEAYVNQLRAAALYQSAPFTRASD
jgi:hypothetical protein